MLDISIDIHFNADDVRVGRNRTVSFRNGGDDRPYPNVTLYIESAEQADTLILAVQQAKGQLGGGHVDG